MSLKPLTSFKLQPYFQRNDNGWRSDEHMIMAVLTSNYLAGKFFKRPTFYTDGFGIAIFKDVLKDFASVENVDSTSPISIPDMWSISKLSIMAAQTEPYIHLDIDSFPHRSFPELNKARIVAAFYERSVDDIPYSAYKYIQDLFQEGSPIPDSWNLCKDVGIKPLNMGQIGGSDLSLLKQVWDESLAFVRHNERWLRSMNSMVRSKYNLFLEQWSLPCYLHTVSELDNVTLIFPEPTPKLDKIIVNDSFSHLLYNYKSDVKYANWLSKLAKESVPDLDKRVKECKQRLLTIKKTLV